MIFYSSVLLKSKKNISEMHVTNLDEMRHTFYFGSSDFGPNGFGPYEIDPNLTPLTMAVCSILPALTNCRDPSSMFPRILIAGPVVEHNGTCL